LGKTAFKDRAIAQSGFSLLPKKKDARDRFSGPKGFGFG
jgi:hypothetical protein